MNSHIIFALANLVILIGVAAYFFRKPISRHVFSRMRGLKDTRSSAMDTLAKADADYHAHHLRLKGVGLEMEALLDKAITEGEEGGWTALLHAEKMAERIIEQSMAQADGEVKRRNRKLYVEMVDMSIRGAEEGILKRMSRGMQLEVGRRFLARLGEEGRVGG